ncbi:MAG: hypothetical protein MJ249_07795 [Kiritimatiellae bacterium]|nr:hypothetical protein [Kiritimatiellia bacterium]
MKIKTVFAGALVWLAVTVLAAVPSVGLDELEVDWIAQDGAIPTNMTHAAWRAQKLARRAERLKPVLAISKKWVYCRHYVQGGTTFFNAFELSDAQNRRTWVGCGSSICLAEYSPDGLWKETTLLADKVGCYRDVDVSPDGKRLLFSFKASDRGDDFHLYEMDLATRKVKQLTFGLGVADVEGCYLADGCILFCSSRCIQTVDCFWNEVCNLYRIDADGSHMTRITYDQVHDYYPTTTWDGRIFYTRWEYNDRSQIYPQPLFAMNPDGTNQRAVYGGNSWFPNTIIHARAVPNSPLFFAIGTGHHSRQPGELMRFDPREGREETSGCWEVAPLRRAKFVKLDSPFGQSGPIAAYPYPVDENGVVLAFLPQGWKGVDRVRTPFGFYWTNVHGARELLVGKAGKLGIGRPVPVCVRSLPQRPSKVANEQLTTGVFAIRDVYEGQSMKGVPRGLVKSMRVSSFTYRAAGIGHTGNRGPGGAGLSSSPPAIGGGAWIAKVVLGEVPVAPDGSVAFRAPARTPLYFTLLDGKGRLVQTMRSWTMLQPGETASCVGCHESINQAPDFKQQGLAVNAQALQEVKMPLRGFSYLREVQPILERRCVGCHNPLRNPKIPDLTATFVADPRGQKFWTKSYINLTHARLDGAKPPQLPSFVGNPAHPVLNWVDSGSVPTLLPPLWRGSARSRLFTEMLDKGHGRGITPGEVRTLACWVDLGVPFCATYDEGANWSPKDWGFWDSRVRKRERFRTEGEPRN